MRMRFRDSMFRFGLVALLSGAAAYAQTTPSAIGTWRTGGVVMKDAPVAAAMELTVAKIEADRVSGRYVVFTSGFSGGGSYTCPNGAVSGTFDGAALKVASQETNLCPERVFDLKLEGERLVGKYKVGSGEFYPVAFTRR